MAVAYAGGHHRHATDELLITNFDLADLPPAVEAPSIAEWPDVPDDGLIVAGKQFADLSCCEKERFDMALHAKCRGECRACHTKLVA